jgi:hypothetical protein
MKPKYVRSRALALPSLVVLSAFTQFTLAAIISPGLDGNRIVTAADNGANTVVANGGTDLTPTITIQNGVILTGDPAFQNAIRINVANYTVSNAGSLSGATNGIVALNNLTLTNDALAQISGTTGGINVGSGAIITNDGTILSTGGVAVLMGANANLSNVGLIQGSQGITATNGSLITNSATIRATALGGNAFLGGLGIDNLVLNQDSSVIGNVIGGGGLADSIVFNGGLSALSRTPKIGPEAKL